MTVPKMFEGVEIEVLSKFLENRLREHPEIYSKAINENVCPHCKQQRELKLMHQNCSYVEKFRNYYLACNECHEEIWGLYQDRWNDLYSAY